MDLSFLKHDYNILNKKEVRIILTGGGSGGHTFPLIAIIRKLKTFAQENNLNLNLLYIGPEDFTVPYLEKEGIEIKLISAGKIRRYFSFSNFLDILKTIAGIFQALWHVYAFMPDLIFSKGGYGSFAVSLWGLIFFIPTYIHESDYVPGLTNKIIGKFSKKIFISFKGTEQYFNKNKTILVGNPIREELLINININKENTKKILGLSQKPVLLIIGGSQGSEHINDAILDALPKLINDLEIIHQTGINNYEKIIRESEVIFREILQNEELKKYYHPVAFLEESDTPSFNSLKDVLLISDLIISRAGSGSIFEIAAFKKPSILIPLPWASQEHQKKNAYEYSQTGAAIVIEENNLKPAILTDTILGLIRNQKVLKQMSLKAEAFAKPKAAEEIAKYLLENSLS
ncbi:MAG: UDP-N-acetylglucosamine--N-acetylmuramyl-(pentapeptide) pyrophosphoryl-undecaprenol N-acetylglucosamine transferase [Minisyncoccia bacterium]|jgi:UDP-N-acetylglucosamine--N-acetylmuramyl-(pentapeptide) pyrophosphoryl-undecaprenol N-acetylglucosamine transferase